MEDWGPRPFYNNNWKFSNFFRKMTSTSVRRRPAVGTDIQCDTDGEKGDNYGASQLPASSAAASGGRLQPIDGSVWLIIFSFFAVILLYVHAMFYTVPPAVTVDNAGAGEFVEERARKTLNDLTAFGARPVGSRANEELSVDYLLNEITQIRRQMNVEQHSLDIDVQRVSGTFALDFLGQFTSCYDNVNNVIAKLCPKHGSNDSLLVNCHYDTAVNATGIYVKLYFQLIFYPHGQACANFRQWMKMAIHHAKLL